VSPARVAVLVIDMQRGGFRLDGSSGIPRMPGYDERVERAAALVRRCAELEVPVVFFKESHRRSLIDFGRELDGTEGVHCLEGDDDTEIARQFDLRPESLVIAKRRYSCFFGTDLEILLRGLGVDTLVLLGELTDVCVQYTFADAHQRDFHLRVVTDCCGGSSGAAHDAALAAMSYLQASCLCTADEVGTWLSQVIDSPHEEAR
jgi:nicotinamidase-related amidase